VEPDSLVGASLEVLLHHASEHRRTCSGAFGHASQVRECPCGDCSVLLCGDCHDPIFIRFRSDRDPCEHARRVLAVLG